MVEHRQGKRSEATKRLRRNWHILSYGSDKLPVNQMREYWLSHYKSTITGMAEVKDIRKAVLYLAGYLAGGGKFVRSWSSQGWVFRSWVGKSLEYKRAYSQYLSPGELTKLSLMSQAEREFELEWLLETGYMSSAPELVKAEA